MALTSKTGLLEGVRKVVAPTVKPSKVEFPNITRPAPFVLRPFAGIYNPFPYGCSILCNHPADYEAKDVVKRAKDAWQASEGKGLLLPEELAFLRAGLLRGSYHDGEDTVPEVLFRRYTDTDSRPPTPTPTLASATAVARGRRCLTPDPSRCGSNSPGRPLLVLDLRRSHSQEALAWRGTGATTHQSRPSSRVASPPHKRRQAGKKKQLLLATSSREAHVIEDLDSDNQAGHKLQQQVLHGVKALSASEASNLVTDTTAGSGDEEMTKRRGKHRKRAKKSGRGLEKEFLGPSDPRETQVSTLDPDSHNPSARPSLAVPCHDVAGGEHKLSIVSLPESRQQYQDTTSFLDEMTLKHLQRELDQEVVDSEFNYKKHLVLEAALRTAPNRNQPKTSDEMKQLKKELCVSNNKSDLLLGVPRNFSRQSARFELPMDSRSLTTMKPMEYVEKHVSISSGSLLLYNKVFNRHKEELDEDESDRKILGKNMVAALGEVMGLPLSEDDTTYIRDILGWRDDDLFVFRSWAGVCALCERLLGSFSDHCGELERADFESLPRRLANIHIDPKLNTVLMRIRDT